MNRKLMKNNEASAIPLLLFIVTIVCCGALYTFFFIEIAYPSLRSLVPASDSKTFIMMCMYALPLFVLLIGVFALVKEGLKRTVYYQ